MQVFNPKLLSGLYRPPKDSHKGENGKLLVVGGSALFHAAAFWTADVASRVVDLVHFSSPAVENNELVRQKVKQKFWNGIVVPWDQVEDYIKEDEAIVIGPGMTRSDDTRAVVDRLLKNFPRKKWVIDGGALQEMSLEVIPKTAILTPHKREFEGILERLLERSDLVGQGPTLVKDQAKWVAKTLECAVLLKGMEDIVCAGGDCDELVCKPRECVTIPGGNEGMTKGGTGDVLAGLVGALYCKNDAFLAAAAGSYINKKAGDRLYAEVGPWFNATDLVNEIPRVMKGELGY